jgi:hypothetical protein
MDNMKLYKIYILAVATAVTLTGCIPDWELQDPPELLPAKRVFLMYDNIGPLYFPGDVNEAGRAVAAGALDPDERVVVYERAASGNVISELVRNPSASGGFDKVELVRYEAGENSALNAQTIARVVGDARALFPEDAEWGLAFGSHGSGWLPKTASLKTPPAGALDHFAPLWQLRERALTRYFTSDRGEKLNISEFLEALDRWEWDFVILDDCFMSSVESLYDMRSLCRYIIASPTEIMDSGFPYDRVVKTLFGFDDWTDGEAFRTVGRDYVDYYKTFNDYPYGTIAVIDMGQMDALAATVRDIFGGTHREPDAATAAGFQTYEGLETHVFYDFRQYIGYCSLEGPLYDKFAAQLERTVIYKGHTEMFPTAFPSGGHITAMPLSPDHYSGVNCFVPTTATERLTGYWKETAWYRYVYGE